MWLFREYNVDCSLASKYFPLNHQLFESTPPLQIIPGIAATTQVSDQHHHRPPMLCPNRSIPRGHSLVSGPRTYCTAILTSHLPYPHLTLWSIHPATCDHTNPFPPVILTLPWSILGLIPFLRFRRHELIGHYLSPQQRHYFTPLFLLNWILCEKSDR